MKKQSNLTPPPSRMPAGYETLNRCLGCVLSGVAAILGLMPYVCVWMVARNAWQSIQTSPPRRSSLLGMDGGSIRRGQHRLYFAA